MIINQDEKLILENYAPPCVIINEKHEILFFYGQTERYLSPPTGVASFNILKMVREDLRYPLTIALQKAIKQRTEIVTERLKTRYAENYAKAIFDTIREPLLVLDEELKVVSANRSFYSVFHVTVKETRGNYLYNLGNNQWDLPEFRELLEKILSDKSVFNNFKIEREFPSVGQKTVLLNARQLLYRNKKFILLAFEDVTLNSKSI
ncbi:MAG: PAS domain-containing protein [Candidatus Scalindua sp.]|nr:PAS domain-containing protein [Candidatus Scalindua sp.]